MFHLSVEEKEALVQRLASNPNVDVTVLIKFCRFAWLYFSPCNDKAID